MINCFLRKYGKALLPILLAGLSLHPVRGADTATAVETIRLVADWKLQDTAKVADSGNAISRPDYKPEGWYAAVVPGTVLTTLVKDGVYPEPLYGENNRPDKIPDSLCRTAYWYRAPMNIPKSYTGKRVWLNFEGINYTAEVWVNGQAVGSIKGAFARGLFDVTAHVSVGKDNVVAVKILPQPNPGATHEKTIATGTGSNGGVTASDGPSFMCTIGWDWIPTIRDRDMGIWQDVTLSASGPVVIQDPYVTSKLPLPRTDSADLTVQATVRNATDEPQNGTLTGIVDGIRFEKTVSLAAKESRVITFSPATTPALHLNNPRLWWPNGYGAPNLYKLRLSYRMKDAVSDTREVSFGIRQLAYALPGSDNLALSVNGVPVVAKGGDWGMDEAMKRIPRARLDAEIRMHKLANYTIIRNWVGQSTSEDFYDLCDRYGILVWDEFFQPNPADGPNPTDSDLYLTNIREKILRVRNHACVVLWCARNEGDPPASIGQGIQTLINTFDPGRLYQASSADGRGVASGGPYHWRVPRDFYTFGEAFKTEIGSMSVPTLEGVHAMMPSKDWEIINDDWAEHDFCAGAQQGDRYPEIITSRYGFIANLADFVRKAQLANYECFRAMYEGRFAKLFKPSTGVITWMSNPAQPSFVWQLYSHDLEPNASLYGTRVACEPVHIQMNQDNWRVMVVNNKTEALSGVIAKTAVYNLDGTLRFCATNTLTAAPSAATDGGGIAFPEGLSAVHFVKLELRDSQQKLLSENFYWRALPEHQDDFQALNSLPSVALDVQARQRNIKDNCLLDVTVRNPSTAVALMSHFQLRQAKSGLRVLPVFYSNNYISLLPGESKTFTIEAAGADLGNEAPLIVVDGWNVTVTPVEGSGKTVGVKPNTDAIVASTAAPAVAVSDSVKINCGGASRGFFKFGALPMDDFSGDRYNAGGETASIANQIDTSAPHAAPASVYQTERWGQFAYTVPVKKGQAYTVRLHFAESKFDAGGRKFNVEINGSRVLADFDIAAEAGKNKALVKEFPAISPDNNGNIVIRLVKGAADLPKICGIEVVK